MSEQNRSSKIQEGLVESVRLLELACSKTPTAFLHGLHRERSLECEC